MVSDIQIEKSGNVTSSEHLCMWTDVLIAEQRKGFFSTGSKQQDASSNQLPQVHLSGASEKSLSMPTGVHKSAGIASPGESSEVKMDELAQSIDDRTHKALMKDADLYPPVQNSDGSTTYTVVLAGMTDRAGRNNSIDYYRRNVNITVPKDHQDLKDCKYNFGAREIINKEGYDKLLDRDMAANPEMAVYAHGTSTEAKKSDNEALVVQLSTGRPTINLDWDAKQWSMFPTIMPAEYAQDSIAAKNANDNKGFEQAIDETIQKVGADHASMIGYSHGTLFETRYMAHRVGSKMAPLENIVFTHPDVPLGAPELQVNGKPELFKDAARHSYVIGGKLDLNLKAAVPLSLPFTPVFELGDEERLGDDSDKSRSLIVEEGAVPISERDRTTFSTEHFLNFAGINQVLEEADMQGNNEQSAFEAATDRGRADHGGSSLSNLIHDVLHSAESMRESLSSLLDF